MTKAQQLPLDLGSRAAYEKEDFFVSTSNQDAVSWLDKWPNWGEHQVLIIIGAPSSGKTHLAKVWQKETSAIEVDLEYSYRNLIELKEPNIVIDNIHEIAGNSDKEKKLFHIYNIVKENQGSLLLTSTKPIKDCDFTLADLKSRLMAAAAVTILPPDENLMAIMLTKIFSDKQVFVPQEVIKYIIPRIERSFKSVKILADKIDYKALTDKKSVTIPLVKSILEN